MFFSLKCLILTESKAVKFKNLITAGMMVVIGMTLGCEPEAYARGGGGFSSSRSSSFSSSRSSSKPSYSSKTYSSKSVKTTNRSSTVKSKTDSKAYQKAKINGKAFTSKTAAIQDFKSKVKSDPKTKAAFAKSYPTTYDKQPDKRPSHIPETYTSGGNSYNVTYQNGGYGYMGPNGWTMLTSYMLMDTMSDAMLMQSMTSQGYYVGSPQVADRGVPIFTILGYLILAVIIIAILWVIIFPHVQM